MKSLCSKPLCEVFRSILKLILLKSIVRVGLTQVLYSEIVDSFCTRAFRNKTYKTHRENILFEREQARLPETQPYVERTLQIRSLRRSYSCLMQFLETVKSCGTDNIIISCRHYLIELLREIIHDIILEANALSRTDPTVSRTMPVYTQACLSENCRGFLADNYVCGICKKEFCEKCHEEKHEGHVCDPNTVKSIKLLKKDTSQNFVKNFTLELVHIHVNNYGLIDKFDRPTVLELTFSPKDFNNIRTEVEKEFPVLGLDQPNNKNKQDLPILFEDN